MHQNVACDCVWILSIREIYLFLLPNVLIINMYYLSIHFLKKLKTEYIFEGN